MTERCDKDFRYFMTDRDGEYSLARILAEANRLRAEGRKDERIIWALVEASFELTYGHTRGDHENRWNFTAWHFRVAYQKCVEFWEMCEKHASKICEEIEAEHLEKLKQEWSVMKDQGDAMQKKMDEFAALQQRLTELMRR